ncbi:uncharacterized protein TRIREDRAFT_108251 [Trichoderma reesei QM6a]|uniref:Predicted protein n=2 Tax=Hypocrea jecorina TaxID=51453 RepID=G0RL60_HYPJQ|nr:uncharacterized protein TRIREDRAFT_108251 [Trichoderma reesei QM6a]EGR47953.1 predicted protein [Trichoderma reesei QM6a]ETS02158.1 hypothetical protein M419DRAFT_78816 [Trichoderma reesei RUT C-30]
MLPCPALPCPGLACLVLSCPCCSRYREPIPPEPTATKARRSATGRALPADSYRMYMTDEHSPGSWWCAFKGTDFGPEAYGMAFLQYYYVSYRISTDYADIGSWNS